MRGRAGLAQAAAAAAALAASLALFWPGIALYDSVDQYGQVLAGAYDDWHPPVMARLWSLFRPWWPGTAPMLVLQLSLFWLGLGLIAAACARRGRAGAGWAVLAAGAWLLASCWMGAVLKDAQMVGALAAATGIVAWHRIGEKMLPAWAAAFAVLLLVYAVLLRANAVFAVAPLAFALSGWGGIRGWKQRAAALLAAILLVILVSPSINHRLLGARPSGIEKSLLIYDIAGSGAPAGRCYSPLQWDGLVAEGCPGAALMQQPMPALAGLWVTAIARHPLAYAAHRLGHFDMTMRLFVPAGLPHAVSPVDAEPNRIGLGARAGPALGRFRTLGLWCAALPPGWPALWLTLDLLVLAAAAKAAPGALRDLGLALALSSAAMGASFLVVSIASDLRYHLWTMLAAMLAFALFAGSGAFTRRHWAAAALILAVMGAIGGAGRLLLPPLA